MADHHAPAPAAEAVEMNNLPPRFPEQTEFERYINEMRHVHNIEAAQNADIPASASQKQEIARLASALHRGRRFFLLLSGIIASMAFLLMCADLYPPQAVLLESLDGLQNAWGSMNNKSELLRAVQFADADRTMPAQVERYFRVLGWEELVNRTLVAPQEVTPAERAAVVQLFVKGLAGVLGNKGWDSTERIYRPAQLAFAFFLTLPAIVCAWALFFHALRPFITRAPIQGSRISRLFKRGMTIFCLASQYVCAFYATILMFLLLKSTWSNSSDSRLRHMFGLGNLMEPKINRIANAMSIFVAAAMCNEVHNWHG